MPVPLEPRHLLWALTIAPTAVVGGILQNLSTTLVWLGGALGLHFCARYSLK